MWYSTLELSGRRRSRIHLSADDRRSLCGLPVAGEIPAGVGGVNTEEFLGGTDAILSIGGLIEEQPYCRNCLRVALARERQAKAE